MCACRPLCVVLGGAKVADKIGVIASLLTLADVVAVGGRMAFTFLAAMGVAVGQTQVETAWLQVRRVCSGWAARVRMHVCAGAGRRQRCSALRGSGSDWSGGAGRMHDAGLEGHSASTDTCAHVHALAPWAPVPCPPALCGSRD